MRCLVTGATGVLGRRTVAALVAAGHEVTGVSRSPEGDELVSRLGARPLHLDLFDPGAVRTAVAGHEAVIDLATRIPPLNAMARRRAWSENDRLRTVAARHAADAAVAAGGGVYLRESLTLPYVDSGDRWIDEATARRHSAVTVSCDAAEDAAATVTARGGRGIVLRFAQFYAPDSGHTRDFLRLARRGLMPLLGPPDGHTSFVHADDAASAVVAALDAPPGVYNVAETRPARRRELAEVLARAVGRRRLRHLPTPVVRLVEPHAAPILRRHRISSRLFADTTGWRPAHPDPLDGWASVADRVLHSREAAS